YFEECRAFADECTVRIVLPDQKTLYLCTDLSVDETIQRGHPFFGNGHVLLDDFNEFHSRRPGCGVLFCPASSQAVCGSQNRQSESQWLRYHDSRSAKPECSVRKLSR